MSVYSPITGYTWEMLKCYGKDPEPIFRAAGLSRDVVGDPQARISSRAKVILQKCAFEAANDEAYGVRYTQVFHPSHLGPLGYLWMSSATLRDAMAHLRRYSRMLSHQFVVAYSDSHGQCHIGFYWIDDRQRSPSEHFGTLAVLVRMCRLLLGEQFTPSAAEFRPDTPRPLDVFNAHFRCPLRFGRRLDRLVIPRAEMDRPLATSHPEISRVLEDVLVRYLAGLDHSDTVSQVRAAIRDLMSEGDVTAAKVAARLNTTVRTLRRRLGEQGTNFRTLLTEQRRELGQRLVRNRRLSLTEVSYLLGFSNPSAFSRAFRAWTGHSPAQARKQLQEIG